MANSTYTSRALLGICGLALLAQPAISARIEGARVTAVEGIVQGRTAAKPFWHTSAPQDQLLPGEAIRTSRASRAELALGDGGISRLAPSTTMTVGTAAQPSRLRLLLGKLYMKFTKPHGALEVQTPSMTAAVTGTEFLVSVNDDNVSHMTVFEGKVEVTGSQGDKVEVDPGQWVEVEPNKPVGRPTAFGMVELRKTDTLLRDMGTGLGYDTGDDVWR